MTTMFLSPTPYMGLLANNGQPLAGGLMFTYVAGSTTKQNAYTDSTGTTALPNPIVLNVRGDVAPSSIGTSCGLWLNPTLNYKIVLAPAGDTDPPANPIWTLDQVVSANSSVLASLAAYQATLAGVPVGAQMPYGGTTAPSGWLLCYGQAISRTTYSALFALLGTAYGTGDGSTTFNLPDKRGRVSIGLDNMGGSAAGRITTAICGINGTLQGAAGGSQYSQADTLTATSTAVTAINDPGHHHPFGIYAVNTSTGYATGTNSSSRLATEQTDAAVTGITATTSVNTTVTSSLTGNTQNVQPAQVDTWIIYTGVSS